MMESLSDPEDRQEFLEAIARDPAAQGPRLVYADWLGERGDAQGEFIRLQCALAYWWNLDPETRMYMERRVQELEEKYGAEWRARENASEAQQSYMGLYSHTAVAQSVGIPDVSVLLGSTASLRLDMAEEGVMLPTAESDCPSPRKLIIKGSLEDRDNILRDMSPEALERFTCNLQDLEIHDTSSGLPWLCRLVEKAPLRRLVAHTNQISLVRYLDGKYLECLELHGRDGRQLAIWLNHRPTQGVKHLTLDIAPEEVLRAGPPYHAGYEVLQRVRAAGLPLRALSLKYDGNIGYDQDRDAALFDKERWSPALRELDLETTYMPTACKDAILRSSLIEQLVALRMQGGPNDPDNQPMNSIPYIHENRPRALRILEMDYPMTYGGRREFLQSPLADQLTCCTIRQAPYYLHVDPILIDRLRERIESDPRKASPVPTVIDLPQARIEPEHQNPTPPPNVGRFRRGLARLLGRRNV